MGRHRKVLHAPGTVLELAGQVFVTDTDSVSW